MEKKKKTKVLFISSTGGHLSEMLRLSPMFEKYDYHIITEKTKNAIDFTKETQSRFRNDFSNTL